jgi:surface protein
MKYMFNACRGLSSLDLSGFDMGSVTDAEGMFQNCCFECIETPINVNIDVELNGAFIRMDTGETVYKLPKNIDESVTLISGSRLILSQPQDFIFVEGTPVMLNIETAVNGLVCSWYSFTVDENGDEHLTEIGKGSSIDVTFDSESDGKMIKCIISDTQGHVFITSDTIVATMVEAVSEGGSQD